MIGSSCACPAAVLACVASCASAPLQCRRTDRKALRPSRMGPFPAAPRTALPHRADCSVQADGTMHSVERQICHLASSAWQRSLSGYVPPRSAPACHIRNSSREYGDRPRSQDRTASDDSCWQRRPNPKPKRQTTSHDAQLADVPKNAHCSSPFISSISNSMVRWISNASAWRASCVLSSGWSCRKCSANS